MNPVNAVYKEVIWSWNWVVCRIFGHDIYPDIKASFGSGFNTIPESQNQFKGFICVNCGKRWGK